jgi:hypothetical protein
MTNPGDHRRVEYVVQRSIARWLGAAGGLLALAMLLMVGCMWTWIRNAGQATPATSWLLAVVGVAALSGGVCAVVARMWAR